MPNYSFTVNDMAMGCPQGVEYGHIRPFARESGWAGQCCEMISGHALNNYCQGRRAVRAALQRTTEALSKPSFWSLVPAVRGEIFRGNRATGIGHKHPSRAGARRVSGSAWRRPCKTMPTWSICSSTRPSFAPTSIPPAPKKRGQQEIGSSRGGLTTKLHVAVGAFGNSLRIILSAGQVADIEHAPALIKDQPAEFIVTDKGHDSDAFVTAIAERGCQAVVPPRSNRLNPRKFDRHIYKNRNLIERIFARIKQFRLIATRYDKLAQSFLSFVHLVCTIVWLA